MTFIIEQKKTHKVKDIGTGKCFVMYAFRTAESKRKSEMMFMRVADGENTLNSVCLETGTLHQPPLDEPVTPVTVNAKFSIS